MTLLGRLFLLTLREDIAVPRAEFVDAWTRISLPPQLMPKPRSLEDAFRKALPKKVVRQQMSWMDYTGNAKLEAYPHAKLKTVLIRVAPRSQEVAIQAANAAVVFLDGNECRSVALRPLLPEEHAYIEQAKLEFLFLRDVVDGAQARSAIQKLFASCSTLAYRDGAYLIPAKHLDITFKIEELILFLQRYSTRPSQLKIIAYIDTPAHRADLIAALDDHIRETYEYCDKELRKLKPETAMKQQRKHTRADTLLGQLHALNDMIRIYEDLLEVPLDGTRQLHQNVLGKFEYDLGRPR